MESVIAEAARREQAESSLVSVDSTVARARHDAVGRWVSDGVLVALEEAVERTKGARQSNNAPKQQKERVLADGVGMISTGPKGMRDSQLPGRKPSIFWRSAGPW